MLAVASAHATSVMPPSFSELVAEADTIARGTVTAVDARWVDVDSRHVIKTYVTFAVEKALKGTPANVVTLEFLGGTVGPETLRVSGMPQFAVGDREILFISGNGVRFCPLVRMMHGRYRVRDDAATNRSYIARDDNTPLTSTDDVHLPVAEHASARTMASAASAMSRDDFENQVTAEIVRHGR